MPETISKHILSQEYIIFVNKKGRLLAAVNKTEL